MTKPTKTKLEKDIDKLLNSGNSPFRIIDALADAYEANGMLPIARKLRGIIKWLLK